MGGLFAWSNGGGVWMAWLHGRLLDMVAAVAKVGAVVYVAYRYGCV